jgi:hypothetical protein
MKTGNIILTIFIIIAISIISILPWWVNTIIFAPLLIGLSFILLTSFIQFLSGGE